MELMGRLAVIVGVILLGGCEQQPSRLDPAAPLPDSLAELGILARDGDRLTPIDGFAYDLAQPLFSDYASKYRTVHLPAGTAAVRGGSDADVLRFPVGTLISKTFYYPRAAEQAVVLEPAPGVPRIDAPLDSRGMRLLETRILRHAADGWEAVSYLWDEAGREARRLPVGALLRLTSTTSGPFDYLVPDRNQCAACHAGGRDNRGIVPLGPRPANMAAWTLADGRSGYQALTAAGHVDDPIEPAPWPAGPAPRPYLDVNCAHCHSAAGPAAQSGLDMGVAADLRAVGRCKPPVAAGRGSGGLRVAIFPGRAEESILVYRMAHTDPAVMMPELGRSLVHREAVAMISDWIDDLEGDCAFTDGF